MTTLRRAVVIFALFVAAPSALAATPAEAEAACAAGQVAGCLEAANAFRKTEPKRAFDAWSKACALGNETGCSELMIAHETGAGTPKNLKKAAELAEAGCASNSAFACGRAGKAYFMGAGFKKDVAKSNVLYEKGCHLGSPYSCSVIGAAYAFGEGITKDVAKGKTMLEMACKASFQSACNQLAELARPRSSSDGGGGVCPGHGEARCGGKCVDIWSAASRNCGGCGHACVSGFVCNSGMCVVR